MGTICADHHALKTGTVLHCACVVRSGDFQAAWTSQAGTSIRATRIVMHDASAHASWIDALVATVHANPPSSSSSSQRPSTSTTPSTPSSALVVEVHVFGTAPEAWIRYMDGKEGVHAHRARLARDSVRGGARGGTPGSTDVEEETNDPDAAVRCLRGLFAGAEDRPVDRVPVCFPVGEAAIMMDLGTARGLRIDAVSDLLVERCVTSCGKKRLRQWFSFPSISDESRASRLDTIEALASQRHVLATTQRTLRRIGSGSEHAHSVQMMWRNQTLPKRDRAPTFLRFAKTLATLEDLHECASCLSVDSLSAISRARFLVESFLDEAQFPDGMCIRYGICEKLDELKAAHFGMENMMTRIMAHERSRIPKELLRGSTELYEWHLVHVPSVGVFVHVPHGLMPPYLEDTLGDWALAFEPGGCLRRDLPGGLYVSDSCRALNERYGNTMLEIQDREAAFCNQLTDRLLQAQEHLSSAFEVVAEMDCFCALAELAIDQGMCRPRFSTGSTATLSIDGGWHPLLRASCASTPAYGACGHAPKASLTSAASLAAPAPVAPTPNDTEFREGSRALVVIGGPGTGKGVYLEQVAIICFLGSLGSFVPAVRAVIPPIDRIFSLDACRESIHDSSFSAGTRTVAEMLRWGSPKSLFLVESFGSATVSCDGVALAAAVIRDLALTRGLVIFATHMRSSLVDALRGLRYHDAGEEFFRVMHLATVEHFENQVPLYDLRDGEGGEGDIDRGALGFYTGGDGSFGARAEAVFSVMSSASPASLDRDPRFSISRALEAIAAIASSD